MADEAAGVRQDVGPGVPGREGVNLQVVFHKDRSPSRGKFLFLNPGFHLIGMIFCT